MIRLQGGSLAVALLVGLSVGCSMDAVRNIRGPQLTDVPPGLGYEAEYSSTRRVLPAREPLSLRAYTTSEGDGNASILIAELEGETAEDEIRAVHEELEARWGGDGRQFGPLERLDVGLLTGWGWTERGRSSRRLVAVVSVEETERTWTIDFYSSLARLEDEELMRRTVESFSPDPEAGSGSGVRLVFVLVVVTALAFAWRMARRPQHRRRRP
jgi:hypothetical protein